MGASTVVVLVSTYLGFQLWSNSRIYDDRQTVYYPVVSLEEAYHLGKEESKTPEKLIVKHYLSFMLLQTLILL